jgi:hypothetical protein
MNWGQVISIILGSSVLATIFGILSDQWKDQKRIKGEQKEKLYGPLRFYLMLMEKNYKLRQELLKSRQEADQKSGFRGPEVEERMKKFTSDSRELIKNWWLYARKIIKLLENNPQYVKDEDWQLIETLFESYMFRNVVSGEESQKEGYCHYGDDIFEKEVKNEFVVTLDELRKKIS